MEIEIFFEGNKKVNAKIGGHVIKTDQPQRAGGDDSAPTPFDLFLSSIGTCAGIYVKSFCDQRGIDTTGIKIIQNLNFNQETRLIDTIELNVKLPDDFPEKYKPALSKVIDQCTVKRHLFSPPEITVKL